MIYIKTSPRYIEEKKYVFDFLFLESLGVDYSFVFIDNAPESYCIEFEGHPLMEIADVFFSRGDGNINSVCNRSNIPDNTFKWKAVELNLSLVGLFSNNKFFTPSTYHIPIDIVGSIFFMLTRWEEDFVKISDIHGRCLAKDCISYKLDFLHLPIIDYYIIYLREILKRSGEKVTSNRSYKVMPTHDIDHPLWGLSANFRSLIKGVGKDLLRNHSLKIAVKRFRSFFAFKILKYKTAVDVNNTIDFILDISEKFNLKSKFFYTPLVTSSKFDDNYDRLNYNLGVQFREICDRGHKIGLHPSYNSSRIEGQFKIEKEKLEMILDYHNVSLKITDGRQHYLRFVLPELWVEYEKAGLSCDSSCSYPDEFGFRCGTSFSFFTYDYKNRRKLNVKEVPLIVMDRTFLSCAKERSYSSTLDQLKRIIDQIRIVGGGFCLLWHNDSLIYNFERKTYYEIIAYASKS